MFNKNTLVLYKKQPAVISDIDGDKFIITYCSAPATATGKKAQYATQKVRDKDIVSIGDATVSSIEKVLAYTAEAIGEKIAEAHELLLSDETTATQSISFIDLFSLIDGSLEPDSYWFVYSRLVASFEFALDETCFKSGTIAFVPRSLDDIALLKQKADEKEHAGEIRAAFITRLKKKALVLPDDAKYMGDVEALALGQTDKSKTLHEAGISETPEKAHKLLLDTGIWAITRNPYPSRWGLSMQSASEGLACPPEEERLEVPGVSYAIDNAWSTDPDDAVAWDGTYLWVHIADPASTVLPDSSIDKTARNRGATLYIPEGASRMLSEDALADYALGLTEKSRALSFRILFDENGAIDDCAVFKTVVVVKRLSYEEADAQKDSPELAPLFAIAQRNIERRTKGGAVFINLPEVHITVEPETKHVSVLQEQHPESSEMVREMMLLAGEGAARFAFKNGIPFAYIGQDTPEIPADVPDGLAGQYRLRRCMRRRNVGVTPRPHGGLGLAVYSQVTSPLRRYSDLLSHQQLRAFLDGRPLIDKDTLLERLAAGDEAMYASKKAERNSNLHWTLVYLLQNPDWTAEAVCVELKGKQAVFLIPSIGQETILTPTKAVALNETIMVKAGSVDIPNLQVVFTQISSS
ncbi:MAG: RNB domain-containing ribonuclease [Treponema sp.]|nr:RNB domain-containing ribonuclease [Treponema sp.]